MNGATVLEVRRDSLRTHRWTREPWPAEPRAGEVLFAVEKFALTANNVTYAAYGERLGYWEFFPAEKGWGRVPVWAYLRALDSRAEGIATGDRLYGYAPMASHLLVQADRVNARGFVDARAYRQPLPAIYNRYSRVAPTSPRTEALEMLLRPLFLTSFLLFEFLQRQRYFGARRIVMSSASSKTAYGTAFLLARTQAPEVVGLTSPRNTAFVAALGCYARTMSYESLATLPAAEPTLYVDFSGSGTLLSKVHHHFTALVHSCTAGGTQWDALDDGAPLPGPTPQLFFAAPHMARGAGGLQERMAEAWQAFCARVVDAAQPWMRIATQCGETAVETAYLQMLDGGTLPDRGQVLSLNPEASAEFAGDT